MSLRNWEYVAVLLLLLLPGGGYAQTSLEASVQNLVFTAARAGDTPPRQHISVTSAVFERTDFTVEAERYTGAADWVTVNPRRGTTPARLEISIDQTGLVTGEYTARLIVRSGPKQIPNDISLTVEERTPALAVAPEMLQFIRGSAPDSGQSLLVGNAGSGSLDYRVAVIAGTEWLSVSPNSGTTAPNQPGVVRVTIDPTRITGVEYGVVRVEGGGKGKEPVRFQA
jgi:hypothetical protein